MLSIVFLEMAGSLASIEVWIMIFCPLVVLSNRIGVYAKNWKDFSSQLNSTSDFLWNNSDVGIIISRSISHFIIQNNKNMYTLKLLFNKINYFYSFIKEVLNQMKFLFIFYKYVVVKNTMTTSRVKCLWFILGYQQF